MEQFNNLLNDLNKGQNLEEGTEYQKKIGAPSPEELKKQAAEELRESIAGGVRKIFFSIVSLFIESLIVKYLWNFVFTEHTFTYWQSMALVVLVRLVIGGINKKN